MFKSNLFKIAALSFLMVAINAEAELVIQSAQYKAEKGVLFVKGKTDNSFAREVFVIDAETSSLIATVNLEGGQFRSDLALPENQIPCMVQIQTNRPVTTSWWQRSSSSTSTSGNLSVAIVRHAPLRCSD